MAKRTKRARRRSKEVRWRNNLQQFRLRALMSREELARKAGITSSAVAKIENGLVVPRISTRRKILEALDVKPERILEVFP